MFPALSTAKWIDNEFPGFRTRFLHFTDATLPALCAAVSAWGLTPVIGPVFPVTFSIMYWLSVVVLQAKSQRTPIPHVIHGSYVCVSLLSYVIEVELCLPFATVQHVLMMSNFRADILWPLLRCIPCLFFC